MTHGVGVPLIASLIIRNNFDTRALSRSADDLKLFIEALREAFEVLESLGFRIVPQSQKLLKIIPRFILVAVFRSLIASKLGKVGAAYHVSQATDEMNCLAHELMELVERSGLSSPSIRKILSVNKY